MWDLVLLLVLSSPIVITGSGHALGTEHGQRPHVSTRKTLLALSMSRVPMAVYGSQRRELHRQFCIQLGATKLAPMLFNLSPYWACQLVVQARVPEL